VLPGVLAAAGKLQHTHLCYDDFAEPQPGRACTGLIDGKSYWPRGKGLGGSTLINYMAYVRCNPADYDSWAKIVGDDKWSYKSVLPVFKRMEGRQFDHPTQLDAEYHGTQGPLTTSMRVPAAASALKFVEAAKALGHKEGDYNGADQERVALMQHVVRRGGRCSAAIAYIWVRWRNVPHRALTRRQPNLHRPNLHVVLHAQGRRVLFNAEKRATGVEFTDAAGAVRVVHASKEVVVSCSAVGSPLILMGTPRGQTRQALTGDGSVGHRPQGRAGEAGREARRGERACGAPSRGSVRRCTARMRALTPSTSVSSCPWCALARPL